METVRTCRMFRDEDRQLWYWTSISLFPRPPMPCKRVWPEPDELIFAVLRSCGVHGASPWSKQKQERTLAASWAKSSPKQSQNRQAAASLILVFAWNKASSQETRAQCVSRIPGRYIRLPCSTVHSAWRCATNTPRCLCGAHHD